MIIAEPEIWETLVMDIPKLKKFQSKSFPLYNCLATLYEEIWMGKGHQILPLTLMKKNLHLPLALDRREMTIGKKRKVVVVLQNYLDFKRKQSKAFMEELNKTTKLKDDCSIKNCLGVLESIEDLSDEEKAKATSIFKCEVGTSE